jgi:hypothetical protein
MDMEWPDWWFWDVELIPHVLKRMVDRGFNETDLRLMFEGASSYHKSREKGRWVIETTLEGRNWEIVVEPLREEATVLIITAYPTE